MTEDRGGLEPLDISRDTFTDAIRRRNHTLKRALTSQSILSGIGNAYSDEILWEAGLSPVKMTSRLTDEQAARLHGAVRSVLTSWIERLATEAGDSWPTRVTAFRPEMAVHGKYGQSCPRCGAAVQRIVYAANETNYCASLPDGRKASGRPLPLPPPQEGLAEDPRRTGGEAFGVVGTMRFNGGSIAAPMSYIGRHMRAIEDLERTVAQLNRDLKAEGDSARVRFMTSGPSWHEDDDGWQMLAFWELPEPEASVWPSSVLWRYRDRIQELFKGTELTVTSYFRTREELETGEHHTGWPVPELA